MPPRYAYWTIIIDNQPTAFRSAAVEELIPTFNRLKSKQPTAVLKWFQDGKLWDSRLDAREANIRMRRDERPRPQGRPSPPPGGKLEWQPKGSPRPSTVRPQWQPKSEARPTGAKLDWSPRGAKPADRPSRASNDWRSRGDKPSGPSSDRGVRGDKPSGWSNNRSARRDKPSGSSSDWRARGDKPSAFAKASADKSGVSNDRRPRGDRPSAFAKPSADKSRLSDDRPAQRDAKWRPGGDHRDPRQKYKDAKKAKWTRFKQAIRGRRPPRKP